MEEIEACIAATNAVEAEIEAVELAHIIERFLDTLTVENRVLFIFREGTGTRKLRISAIGILLTVPPATFLKIADRKASVHRIYIK